MHMISLTHDYSEQKGCRAKSRADLEVVNLGVEVFLHALLLLGG